MSYRNKVIIAAAGSGKTTSVVRAALRCSGEKVLITTYTIKNAENIRQRLIKINGFIPSNITITTWFSFLLDDGVRPYYNLNSSLDVVRSINFVTDVSPALRRIPRVNVEKYYFDSGHNIYSDVVGDFVFSTNKATKGKVIRRLEKIFDSIFIDEVQDLAGYDLDILELLFKSTIKTTVVGDPRQSIYRTNRSSRQNSQFRGVKIFDWFTQQSGKGNCTIQNNNKCYRSNQLICDFADALYPNFLKTKSVLTTNSDHDGIFVIDRNNLMAYHSKFEPVIIRHDKRTDTCGLPALNFGLSKGLTFDRVLIIPTQPIINYLINPDPMDLEPGSIARLYVGITRARYSVAFATSNANVKRILQARSKNRINIYDPLQI